MELVHTVFVHRRETEHRIQLPPLHLGEQHQHAHGALALSRPVARELPDDLLTAVVPKRALILHAHVLTWVVQIAREQAISDRLAASSDTREDAIRSQRNRSDPEGGDPLTYDRS